MSWNGSASAGSDSSVSAVTPEQGKRVAATKSLAEIAVGVRQGKFQLLSIEDVLALPPPVWLIKPLMELGTLVVLYGPSGAAKTFLALAWALSVATGLRWMDCEVHPGPVVYIVAEGGRSIVKRVLAWMCAQRLSEIDATSFILEAVQLLEEDDVTALLDRLRAVKPVLVIFDTMARCFVGGDENQARDIGRLVCAARQIQEETGATVLLVHHTGKKDVENERGSNALRGACDTMILQVMDSTKVVTVSNTKQKDHEEFAPISLCLKPVSLGTNQDGEEVTSCVLEAHSASETAGGVLTPPLLRALSALMEFPDSTAHSTRWQHAIGKQSPVPAKTFHNWRQRLLDEGCIENVKRCTYRVTPIGRIAVESAQPHDAVRTQVNAAQS